MFVSGVSMERVQRGVAELEFTFHCVVRFEGSDGLFVAGAVDKIETCTVGSCLFD